MRESKSRALPLGYTPIWLVLKAKDRSGRSGPSALRAYGVGDGTRTPDPLLRRQLLYPPELQALMERVMGIEPTRPAWKAGILPLNYTRMGADLFGMSARK